MAKEFKYECIHSDEKQLKQHHAATTMRNMQYLNNAIAELQARYIALFEEVEALNVMTVKKAPEKKAKSGA